MARRYGRAPRGERCQNTVAQKTALNPKPGQTAFTTEDAEITEGSFSMAPTRAIFDQLESNEIPKGEFVIPYGPACMTRLFPSEDHGLCLRLKEGTFVGALRLEGMTAPMVLDGAMHGAAFLAYVEQVLVPTLSPGDIVIMDNLVLRPQVPRRASRHRGYRCRTTLPAALQPRLQSYRDGLLQTQGLPQEDRRPQPRRPLGRHRQRHQHLHAHRMSKLLHCRRI